MKMGVIYAVETSEQFTQDLSGQPKVLAALFL